MKPKQFNTNIIFRTTTTLRDKFKQYCKDNNTTISKEFNNYMNNKLNTNIVITTRHYIGKGHPLYGMYVTNDQYNKFNELYNSNVNGCNEEQLKQLCLEIEQGQ